MSLTVSSSPVVPRRPSETVWPLLRQVAPKFVLMALACTAIGVVSIHWYRVSEGLGTFSRIFGRLPWLDMWIRWDSRWYYLIATEGYFFSAVEQSSVAFFPLYPLLMRAGGILGLHPLIAGILITAISGLIALCLFYRWAMEFAPDTAILATWLVLLWPFAFFLYGAVYSDALFLALILGAFLAVEHDRLVLATVLGALASATRPVAPAVVLGLVLRQAERRLLAREPIRPYDLLPFLASLGLAAYMAYQYWRFGTPFAYVLTQAGWQQDPSLHNWLKLEFFRSKLFAAKAPLAFLHASLSLLFLGLAIPTWKRLSRAYAVYVLVVLGIPFISSREFISLARYAIAAFPCFLTLAMLLKQRPVLRVAWMSASAVLLVILTSKFALGRYIS